MLKIINNIDKCFGCSACMAKCPVKCIKMKPNNEGFMQPNIDEEVCINCNECSDVCPAINVEQLQSIKGIYYGWNQDGNIRMSSSSGGIFSAIAENILNNNGVVFGVVYDSKLRKVTHTSSDVLDYSKQRKSKYVESDMGDTFSKARNFLNDKRLVLFSGTPCQIHGLKRYLGKHYDNLITCDFICHGVPSMKLLNDHLAFFEKRYKSKVLDIEFRPKAYGWSSYNLKLNFKNNRKQIVPAQFDSYLVGFLYENIFFKKTCYSCEFRNNHASDIILADFWGIKTYKPEMNDEKGVSLVIINSMKGQKIVDDIKCDKVVLFPLEEKHVGYCFADRDPLKYSIEKRNSFFKEYCLTGYKIAFRKFIKVGSTKDKFKFYVKIILKKVGVI